MRSTRTLSLEIVRQGPPHNTLLSPTTEYLALCGNHAASSVLLKFEHHEFLLKLRPLRYDASRPEDRISSLQVVGKLMAEIFERIPGLNTDLGVQSRHQDELVHLQLVVSAAELALLPFEAALAPAGSPGAGKPLSLQTAMPMSITRQIRRAFTPRVAWASRPRILCVISSAGGAVPAQEHVQALATALSPWVQPAAHTSAGESNKDNLDELLTVLTDATLPMIRDACAKTPYTHVHILAHGAPYATIAGDRYGLALNHPERAGMEVVDGERLVSALRAHKHSGNGDLSHPCVVTIAACDGGNVSTVIPPGASLAHAIHAEDVPFVVTSQFPLSKAGSIILAHVMYERLLWGDDPRLVLHDVRQRLTLLGDRFHDWASLVAYAALGSELDSQLKKTRIEQATRAADAAIQRADSLIARAAATPPAGEAADEFDRNIARELKHMSMAKQRLRDCLSVRDSPDLRAEIHGRCASVEKRRAHIHWQRLKKSLGDVWPAEKEQDLFTAMGKAAEHYLEALKEGVQLHWLTTQYVTMQWLLTGVVEPQWWALAAMASWRVLRFGPDRDRRWVHGSLLELGVLGTLLQPLPLNPAALEPEVRLGNPVQGAHFHAEQFVASTERNSFPMLSTRRTLERYLEWYIPYLQKYPKVPQPLAPLEQLVRELIAKIPQPTSAIEYPDLD